MKTFLKPEKMFGSLHGYRIDWDEVVQGPSTFSRSAVRLELPTNNQQPRWVPGKSASSHCLRLSATTRSVCVIRPPHLEFGACHGGWNPLVDAPRPERLITER